MQFIDRTTSDSRIDDSVQPLIDGILNNRRIFSADQEDPPFVTEAVKYRSQRQKRRSTSPYEGDDPFVEGIQEVFDFDPLQFQLDSWQAVDRLDKKRHRTDGPTAGIFSAPTGFGKTEAFLGPLYQLLREGRQNSVAVVYPSRALLQDQLGRILEHLHLIKSETDDKLSVGIYTGSTPYEMEDVRGSSDVFDTSQGRPRFRLANCWCGSDEDPNHFELRATSRGYTLRCEANDEHVFTDRELVLPRKEMVFNQSNRPDILLTTLESLEGFALKPHYPLVDNLDTIVLDEVHLYTQMRGAHTSKVIENINAITDQSVLWLGSSATIDDAAQFGRRLFGIDDDITTVKPGAEDFDDDHDDQEHYYFLKSAADGPGASSMSIQQHMLFGHSLLEPAGASRKKMLAFIDSISQVNQKRSQLLNADSSRKLWEYHLGQDDVEDWRHVADSMGYDFIEEPLEFMPVYSDRGFDSADLSDTDVLLSTSFLEVGIDVGEISIITQYRTPWDLSSFKQRAGRAARKKGMDAHVVVMLSSLTGDANMFYRAERFLDSEIRTPLKTDNDVVEWIHDKFRRYYQTAAEVNDQQLRMKQPGELFLEEYLGSELGYETYLELILDPATFFEREFDIGFSSESLTSEALVNEASAALESYLDGQRREFEEIESFFEMDDGGVVRGAEAVDTYVHKVQRQVLDLINALSGQVSGYASKLEAVGVTDYDDEVESLQTALAEHRERAAELPEGSAANQVSFYQQLLGDLFGMSGRIISLQSHVQRAAEESIPNVDTKRLQDVQNAVNQLNNLSQDDSIREYYATQKRIYYLQEALDELHQYVGFGNPHLSLYAMRHLLRGAYYLDRYLQVDDRTLGEVWYVPPNYYGDSGRYFTVFHPGRNSSDDESIDKLVSTYTPYRSEYDDGNQMTAFLPNTRVTEDGVEFDYSAHVSGESREGILVPDSIQLDQVDDLSGDSALNIVQYCPECYQILSDSGISKCLRHDRGEMGKIHSDPQVSTRITERDVTDARSVVSIADLTAEVALEGVTLSIRPASWWDNSANFDGSDPFEVEIDSPDRKLGFQLDTRGLVFDLSSFVDRVHEDEVQDAVSKYKDLDDDDYEYTAYHTAAHFFLQVVSDISSVNSTMLFYGFDRSAGEVYVFERTEGGQGIVDLVYNELSTDPGSVLETINRFGYNPQVINERLWAQRSFVEGLPDDPDDEATIRRAIEAALPTPYDSVVDRVSQEVISTVDKAAQFATDESIPLETAYRIKHTVAVEQVSGVDEFPTAAVESMDVEVSENDRVERVFYSPDIDGCVENLHLSECIAAGEQSESLSYVMLEALREHITESVPSDEATTEMFDRELLPGGEFDGTSVFVTL